MKNLSLQTKTFLLLTSIVLLATIPLIGYYVATARAMAELGSDPAIETTLRRAVQSATTSDDTASAALSLKKYRQMEVLKRSIVAQVISVSLVYFALVVAVALAIGYAFIVRITRPLKELTAATARLSIDNLDTGLTVTSGGEIGRLMHAFNAMAENLRRARQEKILAERKATWQRVARVIAHEIKNPLTPIKLSTERMYEKFLMQSKDFPDVIKSTTSTILTEIANLQKLVEAFHRYAKFPDPVLRPANINHVVKDTCALFDGESTPVTCACDDDAPAVMLDAGQIREALTNLIRNALEAIEAAGRPGAVRVGTRRDGGNVVLTVGDNGCGIAPENLDRLFQPYFTTKAQGNGIGLALTERIVTLHGGKVRCESEPGKGTTFTITMPTKEHANSLHHEDTKNTKFHEGEERG